MGAILPRDAVARIGFFENHTAAWSAHAAAIGTSAAEVAALSDKTLAARDAFNAQQQAIQQARAATAAYHEAVRAMTVAGTDVIRKVKATAAVDGESVYDLALIPAPAAPSPVGPPGPVTGFAATLDPTGVLNLAWKCANPPGAVGTIYQVSRQLAAGPMQIIGAAGDKKFADATLPAGTPHVTYRVVGLRSTAAGPAREFTVKLGVPGAGETTAPVIATPPTLAA